MNDGDVLLVYAHPYPDRSRANRVLLNAVRGLDGLVTHDLYTRYPEFDIDVPAEQLALTRARLVVWQHPLYWYGVPALLKHWFDKVLARGWAYGDGGTALRGKAVLWAVTTGGDDHAFSAGGMHAHPLEAFVPPIAQTARFCGMGWHEPFVVHGAHRITDDALRELAVRYRARIAELAGTR